jgi:hypothetical protein
MFSPYNVTQALAWKKESMNIQSILFPAALAAGVLIAMPGMGAYARSEEMPKPLVAASYKISPAASKIKVDGILDEDAWSKATVMKLPYEWMPGDNAAPPVDTDCLVTYDHDRFYIAFRCYDPDPGQIRAHLMDRDASDTFIQDDHINVLIDAFNDERRGFEFRVNPLGVQADANFSQQEGYEDFSWDAIWDSAGKITDWGYTIEMAIPFNQLRFPRTQAEQTWGFSAERSWPRNVRHRMETHPRDRNVLCLLCQINKISGIRGISPGSNIEIDPTVTSKRTDSRQDFPAGPIKAGKIDAEPGITARWGITPNLIFNATANPDFSQVEADVAQLAVNTRFALYYPEKRPFFLEGADFFLSPLQAVFTRTVADPAGGIKLTGKVGENAIGFFGAYDRINNLIFPSNQGSTATSLEEGVTSGVFRYRRDLGRASTIGVLYAGRVGTNYYNHVLGFDSFIWLSRSKSLRFQYLHSESEYPQEIAAQFRQPMRPFGGDGLTANFQHVGREWIYTAGAGALTSNFRADSGFIPQVDYRYVNGGLTRQVWGTQGGWFTQLQFGIQGSRGESMHGRLTDQAVSIYSGFTGPLQSNIRVTLSRLKEFYKSIIYDRNQFSLGGEIKPVSGVWVQFSGKVGDSVDYSNSRLASVVSLMPGLEYNVGRHINLDFSHVYERLNLKGKEIYIANLSQARLVYNFNVRTFVRAIVQFQNVNRNPDLYIFPVTAKTKTFFSQFLFSYKLNPQTVLFLGYSDNYLGMQRLDLTQTDRTFFVKIGYAWLR